MGLDAVELVMDVEETFEIEVTSDFAEQIVTVGDLFEHVKSQVQIAPAGTCLTAATFYKLRSGIELSGIETRFGPSTLLCDVLPKQNRRKFWAAISKNANLRLPDLVRPSWVVALNSVVLLCASLLILAWYLINDLSVVTFAVCFFGGLIALGLFVSFVTRPLAYEIGSKFKTFRDLSESALTLNLTAIKTEKGSRDSMGSNDIWVVLRALVVRNLGVDIDEVTPDARFVKDLGME